MHRIGRSFGPALLAGGVLGLLIGCTSESQNSGLHQQTSTEDKGVVQAGHTTSAGRGSPVPANTADRVAVRPVTWDALQDTLRHKLNGRVVLVDYWMNS